MRRDEGEAPRRLRRAEAVLKRRTSRLVLVCENCFDEHNIAAILRTAEAFGVQHVYLIREEKKDNSQESAVSLGAEYWINIHEFENTASCIESLENDGFDIWATDLNPGAVELCSQNALKVPKKIALVVGREADGISKKMRNAAKKLVFIPMRGFTESFNLSVATGLVLQYIFSADPSLIGGISEYEKKQIRTDWYQKLGGPGWKTEYKEWLSKPPKPLETVRPTLSSRKPRMTKKLANRLNININSDTK